MQEAWASRTACLEGQVTVPGDKSISHRSIMLGAIATGTTRVKHFLESDDCLATRACCRRLGAAIDGDGADLTITGVGRYGLKEPGEILDVGNSGTSIRLLSGLLAGQPFFSVLTGDRSVRKRPMKRITEPLQTMGAVILGREDGALAPLAIRGGQLQGRTLAPPVASAQVKSAILLAGLFAEGETVVVEKAKTRDHTERMLTAFGAEVTSEGNTVRLAGGQSLSACDVDVPGDISSAAFLLVAGAIAPQASIRIRRVGLNPTRTGIIEVLREMGADITTENESESAGEQIGDLVVRSSQLRGIRVGGAMIPRMIDEVPVLAVAAACASGVSEIRDAEELRVKESNRIEAMVNALTAMGAAVEELPDGLRIEGGRRLQGACCDSEGDHRIAMALLVAGLVAQGRTVVTGAECIAVSYPTFIQTLQSLGGEVGGDA